MKNMNRREFLAVATGGTLAALAPLPGCQNVTITNNKTKAENTNIIFVLAGGVLTGRCFES